MGPKTRKRLERAGWRIGSAEDFLALNAGSGLARNGSQRECRTELVAKRIVAARKSMTYMDVARAMVVLASRVNRHALLQQACALGISRQTRCNWLAEDQLTVWLDYWEKRLALRIPAPHGSLPPKRRSISEEDWEWMAGVLGSSWARSWGEKREAIAQAARRNSVRAHLMTIHRVTLWRARHRIGKTRAPEVL
jgi:hypothetical protein